MLHYVMEHLCYGAPFCLTYGVNAISGSHWWLLEKVSPLFNHRKSTGEASIQISYAEVSPSPKLLGSLVS